LALLIQLDNHHFVELYAEIHGLSLDYDDYVNDDYPVVLAAPTGRASKRLQESTGLEAMTIQP
jgi:exodeoxyribonuclease V alpha subunit